VAPLSRSAACGCGPRGRSNGKTRATCGRTPAGSSSNPTANPGTPPVCPTDSSAPSNAPADHPYDYTTYDTAPPPTSATAAPTSKKSKKPSATPTRHHRRHLHQPHPRTTHRNRRRRSKPHSPSRLKSLGAPPNGGAPHSSRRSLNGSSARRPPSVPTNAESTSPSAAPCKTSRGAVPRQLGAEADHRGYR